MIATELSGHGERAETSRLGRVATPAAWLGVYVVAVLWLTWPLGAHLGTDLPNVQAACRFDSPLIAWSLAHQTRSLTGDIWSFPHAPIFHPTPFGLYYGEAGFGALPLYMPTFLLSDNPTLSVNVMMLVSFALTALALHLVVRGWTGSHAAGAAAASTLLASRWLLWEWPPCNSNYAVLFYLPWIVALATEGELSRRRVVLLALLVALQSSVSVYVAASVAIALGSLALVRIVRPTKRHNGLRLAMALGAGGLLVAPLFAGYLVTRAQNPALLTQTLWRQGLPPMKLPRAVLGYLSPMAVPWVALALIALGGAAFVFLGRRASETTRRAWAVASFVTLTALLSAVTPEARWFGRPIRLPHAWLPIYDILRVPIRLGVTGLIGLCLLTGLAYAETVRPLTGRGRRWRYLPLAGVLPLALAMLVERRSGFNPAGARFGPSFGSYPLQAAPTLDPGVLRTLREGSGPVLELPISVLGVPIPDFNVGAMYRSISYRRPILNGYHGYWPAEYPARVRLAERLPDRHALARLVRQTGLETVLVHLDAMNEGSRGRWEALARRGNGAGLRLVSAQADWLVFEVEEKAARPRRRRAPLP